MSPKEKAKELFVKFYDTTGEHWNAHKVSIECALITVDEILAAKTKIINEGDGWELTESNSYWQEVKQEIEKL